MSGAAKRPRELEALGAKVHQAKELISRLRESNRELTVQLETIKARLDTQDPGDSGGVLPWEPEPVLMAELERLRRERHEIRERVSRLLEQLENLEI